MIRPRSIPSVIASHLTSDVNLSYQARKRLQASLAGWANRDGPVKNAPSHAATRDIVPIERGSERAHAADYIDALQTTVVASALAHPAEVPRLVGMLHAILQIHPWHP